MRLPSFLLFIVVPLFSGCILVKRTTYPVPRVEVVSPPPVPLEEVVFTSSHGDKITGWFFETEPKSDSTPVLLYLHGNKENLQTMLRTRIFGDFARLRIHVLVIDYPGYGNSSGKPNEAALVQSANSAFSWVARNFRNNPKYIAGWSMGASIAARVASKNLADLKGIALFSPWISLDSVAAHRYPKWLVKLLPHDHYNLLAIAPSLEIPTLIIHGEYDRKVPFIQGKTIAESCPQLKKWVLLKGIEHDDLMTSPRVWEELGAFLKNPDIDWTRRE